MTPEQTTTPSAELGTDRLTTEHAEQVAVDDPTELLSDQPTLDSDSTADVYVPIPETNLQTIAVDDLSPSTLLYDPRSPTAVLEVIEQYEDDFGELKVRVQFHTSDHRDGKTGSFFADHLKQVFTYLATDETEASASPDEVTLAPEAKARKWGGDIQETTDDKEEVQTALFDTSE